MMSSFFYIVGTFCFDEFRIINCNKCNFFCCNAGDPVLACKLCRGLLALVTGEIWFVSVRILALNMNTIQATEVAESNLILGAKLTLLPVICDTGNG